MQKQCYYIILFFLFINQSGFSQYSISGYLSTKEKNKTVYLSLLKYNEEIAIYPEQVLTSTKTDSTGYFEITGKLLPNENKLYRIHSNLKENSEGFDFIEEGKDKNYHNFIFSNIDSIYFPRGENTWFNHPQNTNVAEKQWRMSTDYELSLLKEHSQSQNTDALIQAEKNLLNEFKIFCSDSLSHPLVKLLAYSHLKRNVSSLSLDFKSNPDFYYDISKELNKSYSGNSYYLQYQEEIAKLSSSLTEQKYIFHKNLNYFLGAVILILFVSLLYLFQKLKNKKKQETNLEFSTLTIQEEKIAKLIFEGKSNKEIAAILFISLSTVKSHIGNINSKLNITNRRQLVGKLQNHTWD